MRVSIGDAPRVRAALLPLFFAAILASFAPSTSGPLTQTSLVAGQCNGYESEQGDELPNRFGLKGLTLHPEPTTPHYAHFSGPAQENLNQTLRTAIATQLAILPITSRASGFTYKYDSIADAFSEDAATIWNGPATKDGLPGHSLGADLRVAKRFTLAFDHLRQTLFDAPRVAAANFTV